MSIMYLVQVISKPHLSCTPAQPSKPKRVNTVWVTKFKVFLSFIHPTASDCCITVIPCHIMRYWELNPNILSDFSGFSLSDIIYIFPNLCLRIFLALIYFITSRLELFAFPWCHFLPYWRLLQFYVLFSSVYWPPYPLQFCYCSSLWWIG